MKGTFFDELVIVWHAIFLLLYLNSKSFVTNTHTHTHTHTHHALTHTHVHTYAPQRKPYVHKTYNIVCDCAWDKQEINVNEKIHVNAFMVTGQGMRVGWPSEEKNKVFATAELAKKILSFTKC